MHGKDCVSCDVWTSADDIDRPVCALADRHLQNIEALLQRWLDELHAGGYPTFSGWAARDYEADESSLETWVEIVSGEVERRKEAGTWNVPSLGSWRQL